jgi:hypothetical protein
MSDFESLSQEPDMNAIMDAHRHNARQFDYLLRRPAEIGPNNREIANELVMLRLGTDLDYENGYGTVVDSETRACIILEESILEQIGAGELRYAQEYLDGNDLFYAGTWEGKDITLLISWFGIPERNADGTVVLKSKQVALAANSSSDVLKRLSRDEIANFAKKHPDIPVQSIACMTRIQAFAYENFGSVRNPSEFARLA